MSAMHGVLMAENQARSHWIVIDGQVRTGAGCIVEYIWLMTICRAGALHRRSQFRIHNIMGLVCPEFYNVTLVRQHRENEMCSFWRFGQISSVGGHVYDPISVICHALRYLRHATEEDSKKFTLHFSSAHLCPV